MAQIVVAIADFDVTPIIATNPTETPGDAATIFLVKDGASDWWECINALGDTALINSNIQIDTTVIVSLSTWTYYAQLDECVDPGVDDQFVLKIRARFFCFDDECSVGFTIKLLVAAGIAPFAGFYQIKSVSGTWDGSTVTGDLADCYVSSGFVTVDIPLTELEVQDFRDKGGFTAGFAAISMAATLSRADIAESKTADYDVTYIALEIPSAVAPDLELTQSGGYEISGSGADYLVQSGGYEVTGTGAPFINEIEQSGGYEVSGGNEYGSNEIVQSGGVYFTGGGSDFYLIAPSVGGIYVLVPNKRDDTWYKRDGLPLETIDVKIPDPFVSLAYLPKD